MERVVLRLNSRRPFSSFFELHLEGSGPPSVAGWRVVRYDSGRGVCPSSEQGRAYARAKYGADQSAVRWITHI
jgi:hypothetical protein